MDNEAIMKMQIIIFFIILMIASIIDIKKREVPPIINIMVLLLAIFTFKIYISGLILPIILIFLPIKIGGGDIKFLGATSLVFGLETGLVAFLLGTIAMCLYKVITRGKSLALPFIPFIFIGNLPILILGLI